MDRAGLALIGTALHPSTELFRVLVGRSNDPDSQAEAWLCVDFTSGTKTNDYIYGTVNYTLLHVNPGGVDVAEQLGSRSIQVFEESYSPIYNFLGFGVDFFRIPGRDELTSETVMTLFTYVYAASTTMTYDVTPYNLTQYAIPQDNQGYGYYK